MKKGFNKKKVIQWILKQRLQDRPSHPEAEQRGTWLLPYQLHLQMHSKSSWKWLMASERFKISILKGWQLCRISWMYFQPSLTASTPTRSTNPLAIPIKKGEIIFWEGVFVWGGEVSKTVFKFFFFFYFFFIFFYVICVYVLDNRWWVLIH